MTSIMEEMSALEIMLPWLIQPPLPQKSIQLMFRTLRFFIRVDVLCFTSQIIVVDEIFYVL